MSTLPAIVVWAQCHGV